jgi:hypothetical protein
MRIPSAFAASGFSRIGNFRGARFGHAFALEGLVLIFMFDGISSHDRLLSFF